jgi:hypothetical protein
MSSDFLQSYAALTDYIAQCREIEIGDSVTSIPADVRPEFYARFNAARDAFVEEKYPTYLNDAAALLERYHRAAETISRLLTLEETATVTPLQRFLQDPKGSLTRELFDPLFDLLKGRETVESFEKRGAECIENLFPAVFRALYEKWAVLSLVDLLEAGRALRVESRGLNPGERAKPAAQAPHEDVPFPAEAARFFISQPRDAIFAVPDFIVHSSRLNRFVGIRSDFREGLYNAWDPSPKREWHAVHADLLILLECGLTLVYAAEEAEDIALVADAARICRPDLVLYCVDSRLFPKTEAVDRATRAAGLLRPVKGIYVIATDPWPEDPQMNADEPQAPAAEPAAGIHFLAAGYDPSKLIPVVEALAGANDSTLAT